MWRSLAIAGLGFVAACSGKTTGSQTGFGGPGGSSGSGGSGAVSSGGDSAGSDGGAPGSSSGSSGGSNSESSGGGSEVPKPPESPGSNGTDASAGGSSVESGKCTTPPASQYLPAVSGTCPTLATGTVTVSSQQVQIWAGTGSQPGPLVFYWHGTGGSSSEATYTFGQAQIDAVTAAGGVVASFNGSTSQGTDTGDAVWYTGDFAMADQIVACGIQQHRVDPCRIYTTGASAGGLQTTWMAYARSGYIAAAASLSGGMTGAGGFNLNPPPQDTSNIVPGMAIHGAEGMDVVVIDFAVASAAWEADIASRHGFSMDCNTGGGHVSGPPQISPGIWRFFEDHPFKTKPEPYPPIPSVYPSYCQIGPRGADGGAP